jgi:hypothetical protein
MKSNLKQILVIIHLFIFLPVFAQDIKGQPITFNCKTSFQTLLKAGDHQSFSQLCTSLSDTVINGSIRVRGGELASIKNCSYVIQMENDTIYSCSVSTFNRRNSKKLVNEALKAYGEPTITSIDRNVKVYTWKYFANKLSAETVVRIEKGKGDLTSSYK